MGMKLLLALDITECSPLRAGFLPRKVATSKGEFDIAANRP